MYYFWTNVNYRQSIFRFKHERHQIRKTQSQDSLGTDKIHLKLGPRINR